MKIAVAGGTGLVGRALAHKLEASGHTVLAISRSGGDGRVQWSPDDGAIEADKLEGCDAIVNLAGENIAQRWTPEIKRQILESRRKGATLLARTAVALTAQPRVFVSASAIGIYGFERVESVDEGAVPGTGFLADVCRQWEQPVEEVRAAGIRTVVVRIGIVLSPEGGALAKMLPVFRAGLGGPVGGGQQRVSWVTLHDLVAIFQGAIEDANWGGIYNAVAPNPVSNAAFSRTLGEILGRPAIVPTPAFAIKLAFGEMAQETVLADQEVRSARLPSVGFTFQYPELKPALQHLLK